MKDSINTVSLPLKQIKYLRQCANLRTLRSRRTRCLCKLRTLRYITVTISSTIKYKKRAAFDCVVKNEKVIRYKECTAVQDGVRVFRI